MNIGYIITEAVLKFSVGINQIPKLRNMEGKKRKIRITGVNLFLYPTQCHTGQIIVSNLKIMRLRKKSGIFECL